MYVQAFNPVNGLSIEFKYDKEAISQAIATQVSLWVQSITADFLELCEAGVVAFQKNSNQFSQSVRDAGGFIKGSVKAVAAKVRSLATEFAEATRIGMKRRLLGLIVPPLQRMEQQYVQTRNRVQDLWDAYLKAEEPVQLSAASEEPIMLPSVDEALEIEEVGHIPNGLECGEAIEQVQSAEVEAFMPQAEVDYRQLGIRVLRKHASGRISGYMQMSKEELAERLTELEGAVV
jgi:hypothetical protein